MLDGLDPGGEAELRWLVSQRYVVEVLDALTVRPLTSHQLRRMLRARRRPLAAAVRALAARGAVRRLGGHGSWDAHAPATTCYELTETGRAITRLLERLEVWDVLYRRYLYGHGSNR